jgi:hypothetical protein
MGGAAWLSIFGLGKASTRKHIRSDLRPRSNTTKDKKGRHPQGGLLLFMRCLLELSSLPHAEADVANGFGAEALFQFSQDVGLGDLFELVVQCRLEDAHIQNAFAQCHRR